MITHNHHLPQEVNTELQRLLDIARRLATLRQPWHPRRWTSADGIDFGPGVGLRHSTSGLAIVPIEHEPDPDFAFWGGNPEDILSEPPGGHNVGRKRTGGGKPPSERGRPDSYTGLETGFVDGSREENGMHIETLSTGNPVGRPRRPEISGRTAAALVEEIERALELRYGVFWARQTSKALTNGSIQSRYPTGHYLRVLLMAAVLSSDRSAAVLTQLLAPIGKRTIERWRADAPQGSETAQPPPRIDRARPGVTTWPRVLFPRRTPKDRRTHNVTTSQYSTLVGLLRRCDARLERLEDRIAFEFPTPNEIRQQLEAEVDSILSPGGGVRVFAED